MQIEIDPVKAGKIVAQLMKDERQRMNDACIENINNLARAMSTTSPVSTKLKSLSVHTILHQLEKKDPYYYETLESILTGSSMTKFTKDELMFTLIGHNFKYDGSLVDLVYQLFETPEIPKIEPIVLPTPKTLITRKYDSMSVNIKDEEYDNLIIDSMSCHIQNAVVRNKLSIKTMSLTGEVKVYRNCDISIDAMTDSLRITYI